MKKTFAFILLSLLSFGSLAEMVYAKIETNRGDIYLELDAEKAPLSVANFTDYAKSGFYKDTIFHRVISSFMIQGGGFDQDLRRKQPKEPIKNEASNGLKNDRGTIAMARTNAPHSATSQFFINVVDNGALDFTGEENSRTWGYAVFGKVIQGMDVVDKIRFSPTGANPPFRSDVPIKTMLIKDVVILDEAPVFTDTENKQEAKAETTQD